MEFYLGGTAIAISLSIPAGLSALIPGLQPILTSTIANRWLGERVTAMQWGLALIGLAGVALIPHDRRWAGRPGRGGLRWRYRWSASARSGSRPWCCRERLEQRRELAGVEEFVVPERAVDAQSLVAYADLVISAGGTMNREAVALGTPVYTTFEGRLGAVDERLLADGRLRRLGDPAEISLEPRERQAGLRERRDPRELVTLLLSATRTP